MIIDTHCHLHEQAFADLRETLRLAIEQFDHPFRRIHVGSMLLESRPGRRGQIQLLGDVLHRFAIDERNSSSSDRRREEGASAWDPSSALPQRLARLDAQPAQRR